MPRFAYVVGVFALLASPAVAQTTATQATQSQQVASDDKSDVNRIVCKKQEKVGSRLGAKKVCLTVQEWDQRAAEDRDETGRVQRDTKMGTPSG